jgi:hypothetical protein
MLSRTFTFLLGLPVMLAAHGAALGAPPRLAVRGPDIVDPAGQPILLRGWNWGHWGKTEAQDAADNAAQGANAVRIPLRWWGNYAGNGVDSRDDAATSTAGISPAHLKHLDDTIRWASQARLWIVLFVDSDCGQNGMGPGQPRFCDPRGEFPQGHNFWSDAQARQRFIAVWRFVANRYKDTPYLGLFEPLPEPDPPGVPAAQIKAFYAEVMAAIREVAPGVPFLVGGRGYKAPAVRDVFDPSWKDVVYTGNLFLHAPGGAATAANLDELRARAQRLLDLRDEHKVPVFVQQVGVRSREDPDRHAVQEVLSHLVSHRVGFTYWEYRAATNPGEYGVLYQQGQGWVAKRDWLDAITPFFKR